MVSLMHLVSVSLTWTDNLFVSSKKIKKNKKLICWLNLTCLDQQELLKRQHMDLKLKYMITGPGESWRSWWGRTRAWRRRLRGWIKRLGYWFKTEYLFRSSISILGFFCGILKNLNFLRPIFSILTIHKPSLG